MQVPTEKIEQIAKQVNSRIVDASKVARNEAEFRTHFARILEDVAQQFDVQLMLREEYTVATGRVDAAYNRLIIEYERPGSLRPDLKHGHTKHAVQQVKDYIEGVAEEQRLKKHRMAGVALDGNYYIFVRHFEEKWAIETPVIVNEYSTARFLRVLFSLTSGKALIPDNLINDFGAQNLTTQRVARAFYNAIVNNENELVDKLFEQWQIFFGEAVDYKEGFLQIGKTSELKTFAKQMGIMPEKADAPKLFFAVHTYFAVLIKLIAYLSLTSFASGFGTAFGELATLPSDDLRRRMSELENGGLYAQLGLRNFLEGDFFRWYLEVWDDEIAGAVRLLLDRLNDYDPGTLEVNPEYTRDLLKKLYHYLMPREIRHDLGEYYTPDWLADRLLNQLGYNGQPDKRLLDPACGSGTFLILAIKRLKEKCLYDIGLNEKETLNVIINNIAGIDLNPLAVIAARTNFILALGDLLQHRTKAIDIPIYLADSIMTPAKGEGLFDHDRIPVKTSVDRFFIPAALKTRGQIEMLTNLLDESISKQFSESAFVKRIKLGLGLSTEEWDEAQPILIELFQKLQNLHDQNLNGVWARIIKNAFMPLFIGEFDYIAGNPPWINWESLPDEYRQESKKLWQYHGLFPHGGMAAILGKGKKDISMLMTYEVMEALLKKDGRLGFVITQTVFKTIGAGQGFRQFVLGDGTPIRPIFIDDMSNFQIFEAATNRTAVMILQKGDAVRYPVPYTVWKKTARGQSIGYDSTLEDVIGMTKRYNFAAQPVDKEDATSAWLSVRPKTLGALQKIIGKSSYKAHAGSYTGGANGVYWLEIIAKQPDGTLLVANIPDGAKRKVEKVTVAIEPDLVYPLLRGRDVQRWSAMPSAHILMVQDPIKRRGIDVEVMQVDYPRAFGYLKRFESILRARAAYRRYFTRENKHGATKETGPFYSMFNISNYTFSKWKVVWREQTTTLTAAVVNPQDGKSVVPDHKLMMVEANSRSEANYLCALLNSVPARFLVAAYAIQIQMDTHILENLSIPQYSKSDNTHLQLAELSELAHATTAEGNAAKVRQIEEEIDSLAAKLWGLSDEELAEIKRSLEEI